MEKERAFSSTKAQEMGGNIVIIIPKHLSKFMELNKGDEVGIIDRHGKYGRYISIWNETKQK